MGKILGLDIGGGTATAFLLDTSTLDDANIRDYVKSHHFAPFEVKLTHNDLTGLCELKPDLVLFEPTGDHYERVFVHWFNLHNIPYRRCVGKRLANFRGDKGLPKTDGIDSFSLALYGHYKLDKTALEYDPKAFVPDCELKQLREWWLQRRGTIKRRAGLINRFRLELSSAAPECRNAELKRGWGEPCPTLIAWLAGELTEGKSAAIWRNRIYPARVRRGNVMIDSPGTCGLGVSEELKAIARELFLIDSLAIEFEQKIDALLSEDRFAAYRKAFEAIGGSKNMMAIYLTRIYPFDRFLVDGRPHKIERLSKNKKVCTVDLSLAQFKAAIGAGTVENTSGIRQKHNNRLKSSRWSSSRGSKKKSEKPEIAMGDRFSREAFFLWAKPQIEGTRGKLVPILSQDAGSDDASMPCDERLIAHSKKLDEAGKNLYQRIGNLQGYHAKLLYKALLKELVVFPDKTPKNIK
jgi:hypothetical protein